MATKSGNGVHTANSGQPRFVTALLPANAILPPVNIIEQHIAETLAAN